MFSFIIFNSFRVTVDELVAAGEDSPKIGDGFFLWAGGKTGGLDTTARIESPGSDEILLESCLTFDFSIFVSFNFYYFKNILNNYHFTEVKFVQHNKGISALRVLSVIGNEEPKLVWELRDFTQDTNDLWELGQVRINANKV